MRSFLAGVVLLAACAPPVAHPARAKLPDDHPTPPLGPRFFSPPPLPTATATSETKPAPAAACVANNDPQIAKLQTAARAKTEAAYARALREASLTPVSVGTKLRVLHSGVPNGNADYQLASAVLPGTVTTIAGMEYLAGPTFWSLAGTKPAAPELVRDGNGACRVVRRAETVKPAGELVVCTCAPPDCGSHGSGCPACGETVQAFYGPIPSKLGGELTVAFEASVVSIIRPICNVPCPPPPPGAAPAGAY